ncbi:hypothetical protein HCN44_003325 [Aphidius gifuensis]|uniref:Aminopeptidase n=1 Tax=Aphidius gifuensis TaxID=684658 RepID=A0A835CVC4_APHGI|nr:hypothetical protein HCN44_003325 [Aphidius gifuensis]
MATEKIPFSRLPTNICPFHYQITLRPDLKNLAFEGTQYVEIEVIESTDTIVLNSLDLDIKTVYFQNKNGKKLGVQKIDHSIENETATLKFGEKLPIGKLRFVNSSEDKLPAAVTFLCPTSARRMFPCWDEPTFKAAFSIILVIDKINNNIIGLSNMPVETVEKKSSTETIKFKKSKIMSTYLVAVIVGEFDYLEDKTIDGTVVRVYTPKNKQEQGRFALEVATKVLPYYNKYFGISYPLPKMDLIAIADFSAGAMENWGLVTYRETRLLVDPENTSAVSKQSIALVVAHELAHQWFVTIFNNTLKKIFELIQFLIFFIVTMEWWTHLWLNEGYASFVEFLCIAHLFPEWDIWTQFVTNRYIKALELDGLKNSHAIEVPVSHPSEIDEIFDDISYNKGASVIRMLHSYIGDDDFRKGMSLYLERHSYANAETEDLWAALEEASNKPIRAVMSTWTKKMGFPVLRIEQKQKGNDRILSLSQERFLSDGSVDEDKNLWMIPISVSTSKSPKDISLSTVMSEKTKEIIINNVDVNDWIKVNPGTIGFYRTSYSPEALSLIMPAIKDKSLPPLDRLGLLDDLSAMVQAGHVSTVEVLRLMQAFQYEDNYTVWSSIVNNLGNISILIGHLDIDDNFKSFGRSLLKDIATKLGWEAKKNESHLDTLLRSLVLGRMAAFKDKDTIEESKKRFKQHVNGENLLPADLRSAVYRAVLADGDEKTFNTMLDLYRKSDLHEEKDRILRSLGSVDNEDLLNKVMEFSMSDEVRAQDTVFVIMSVSSNSKGRILAWEFFKRNWKILLNRYNGVFLLSRLVKYTTENFVTEDKAKEIKEFFKEHPTPGTERAIQQAVESVRMRAAWLARDQAAIENFLKTSGY